MRFPCELKSIGGSKYVIINSLIVDKMKLVEGDIIIVDVLGKESDLNG